MGKTLAITSSPSSIPPLNHHPPLPLVEAAKAGMEKRRFRTSTSYLNRKWKSAYLQTKTSPTVYRSSSNPSIVAVSINEIKKNWGRFFKKSGKQFLKKRKVKKKSGIPPKSGRLTSLREMYTYTSTVFVILIIQKCVSM